MGISKCCISSLLPVLSLERGWGRDLPCPTEPRPLSCPKEPDPEAPTPLALWTRPFPCSGENSKPCCWEGGLGGRRIPTPAVREVFVGFSAGSRGPGRGQPSVLGWKMLFSKVDSLHCEQLPFCLSCVLFSGRHCFSQLLPSPARSPPPSLGRGRLSWPWGCRKQRARLIFASPSRICCLNWEQGKLCLLPADAALIFLFHVISRGWSWGGEGGVHQP